MDGKLIPNREVLRFLRRQGKVAWSREATRAFITVAIVSYLLTFGAHYAQELWDVCKRLLAARPEELDLVWVLARGVVVVIVTTSAIALIVGGVVSLAQTGFLVSIRLMRLGFGRGGASRQKNLSHVLPMMGFGLGGWLLSRYLRELLLVLRQPQEQVLHSVSLVVGELAKSVIVVALIYAILSLVATRLSFLWRHRMTKREIISQLHR